MATRTRVAPSSLITIISPRSREGRLARPCRAYRASIIYRTPDRFVNAARDNPAKIAIPQ